MVVILYLPDYEAPSLVTLDQWAALLIEYLKGKRPRRIDDVRIVAPAQFIDDVVHIFEASRLYTIAPHAVSLGTHSVPRLIAALRAARDLTRPRAALRVYEEHGTFHVICDPELLQSHANTRSLL